VPGSMDYCLSKRGSLRCAVELSWRLLRGGASDRSAMHDLWNEARPCTIFGAPAYSLTPEWELLSLPLHAAKHGWQGLKWLADIDQICSAQRIDWDRAKAKADALGLTPVVEQTLGACHQVFGTAVPKPFAAGWLPVGVRLFPAPASAFSRLRGPMIHYHLLPGVWQKLRCLAELCFVPTLAEYHLIPLPPSFSFLYYLVRPLRLTCKWAWRLLQALLSADRPHALSKRRLYPAGGGRAPVPAYRQALHCVSAGGCRTGSDDGSAATRREQVGGCEGPGGRSIGRRIRREKAGWQVNHPSAVQKR